MATLFINNSTASDMDCATRAWLKYTRGLRARNIQHEPMAAGTIIHKTLEGYFQKKDWRQLFDTVYNETFPQGALEARYSKVNLETIMTAYFTDHAIIGWPWRFAHFERFFVVPLAHNIGFYGTLDMGGINPDESLWVVDTKTTGYIDDAWVRQWQHSAQLMGYVWAARQLFPDIQVRGAYVNAIEVRHLPPTDGNMDRKCKTHRTAYAECQLAHVNHQIIGPIVFSDWQLEQWRLAITGKSFLLSYLQSVDEPLYLPMNGMFVYRHKGNLCAQCEFKGFCYGSQRAPEALEQLLEPDPWFLMQQENIRAYALRQS